MAHFLTWAGKYLPEILLKQNPFLSIIFNNGSVWLCDLIKTMEGK